MPDTKAEQCSFGVIEVSVDAAGKVSRKTVYNTSTLERIVGECFKHIFCVILAGVDARTDKGAA